MTGLLLRGLCAENPLSYLAALGVLRTATLTAPEDRFEMRWEITEGGWRPRLFSSPEIDRIEFIDLLYRQLNEGVDLAAFRLADDLTIEVGDYRTALLNARSSGSQKDRRNLDFLAAFGSEAVESTLNGKPTGQIADTDLRTMSGAGHQHFLQTIRTLIRDVKPSHLDKAIFEPWVYDDQLKNHSMRWDPIDDTRYALRWSNPSGDPVRNKRGSVWGGNRLAIEALPLFPAQPQQRELKTTGFSKRGRATELTWPVWLPPTGLAEVRSLLAHPQLQQKQPNHAKLSAMGIAEIFRSERITPGKYRNFVSPRSV